jgi:hypothetical protein
MIRRVPFIAFFLLALGLTGCSSSEWDNSPLIRKLTHWREPVVARIGDVPLFKSDLVITYKGLPKDRQEAMQKNNDIDGLVQLAIDQYLWRKAAIERGALKSETYKARLETAESESAESWVAEDLLKHELAISENEIEDFGRRDPKSLAERRVIEYHVERYQKPKSRKKSPLLIGGYERGGDYYVGIPNPEPLNFIAGLPLDKPSALVPCGHDLCRYTKTWDMVDSPRGQQVTNKLAQQKKEKWLNSYREKQRIKIEKPADLDGILQSQ